MASIVRIRLAATLVLLTLATPAAFADGGGSAPSIPATPPPETTRPMSPEEQAAIARQKAEATYASAYKDVEKAQKELEEATALRAAGDEKSAKKAVEKEASATKKLKKSAGQFEEVVAVIPDHANAWNMLGYSRRMTGDLDGAFTAYWKCLEIDPNHAGAHEYLGEAYLKSGKLAQARGELAFLEKKKAPEAQKLAAAIDAWVKANPEAAKAAEKASVTPPPVETK
jgi:tetratricopeptide (TPR) repeat protein